MTRIDTKTSPERPRHYVHVLTPKTGFVIFESPGERILCVNTADNSQLYTCRSLAEVVAILTRPATVQLFASAWSASHPCGEDAPTTFDAEWKSVLQDVNRECGAWDLAVPISDRVKKQLLWAFDPAGYLDADRFLTILEHEHINLTPAETLRLVNELTPTARPEPKPQLSAN